MRIGVLGLGDKLRKQVKVCIILIDKSACLEDESSFHVLREVDKMKKSPNWCSEELMLALELYLSKDLEWLAKISDITPEIGTLSYILQNLDFYPNPKPDNYRSVGSVRMKLANYKSLDPRYGKSALSNIGQTDRIIWQKYFTSYDELARLCSDIIRNHFTGFYSSDVNNYIDRLSRAHNKDKGFAQKCNEVNDYMSDFYDMCLNLGEKEVANACKSFQKVLVSRVNLDGEYKEHAGINQERVGCELKIGRFVKEQMERLIFDGRISDEMFVLLSSKEDCRRIFHIGHPLIKEINPSKAIRPQLRDKNGYLRYWKDLYKVNNHAFVLCKEWYESNRRYFLDWLSTVYGEDNIKKNTIIDILKFIQVTDTKEISVSVVDIKKQFADYEDIDELIDRLINTGALSPYQGSLRDLTIDDYDVFYNLLRNPDLI